MKTTLLTFSLALASFAAVAQSPSAPGRSAVPPAPADSYSALLSATITDLMQTTDAAALTAITARLERAASVAPADWLPRYYQAYARLITIFFSSDNAEAKDRTLDQAEAALAQARGLHGDESELLTLQAYIYSARLTVSPMARGLKYSGLVRETVAQAKLRNPANPRPYLVGANNVYYAPKMFGGGAAAAQSLYQEAQAKYAAFQPANALMPNWGQRQLQARLKECAAQPNGQL